MEIKNNMVNLTIDVKSNFRKSTKKLTEKSLKREKLVGIIKLKKTKKKRR